MIWDTGTIHMFAVNAVTGAEVEADYFIVFHYFSLFFIVFHCFFKELDFKELEIHGYLLMDIHQ